MATNRRSESICLLLRAAALLLLPSLEGGILLAQPTLKITEPKDGIEVNAGEILDVTVEASPPGAFRSVIVIGQDPIGFSDSLPF